MIEVTIAVVWFLLGLYVAKMRDEKIIGLPKEEPKASPLHLTMNFWSSAGDEPSPEPDDNDWWKHGRGPFSGN